MRTWPTSDVEATSALWQIHLALIDLRLAAWNQSPATRDDFATLANALDDLLVYGRPAFERRLQSTGRVFRQALNSASNFTGPSPSATEVRAFAAAVALVVRQAATAGGTYSELAKVADDLEYLPCELLRVGASAITVLADPDEPPHVFGLAVEFHRLLSA